MEIGLTQFYNTQFMRVADFIELLAEVSLKMTLIFLMKDL
jgi:hypothetical protein